MLNADLSQALEHVRALTGSPDTHMTFQAFSDAQKPNPDPLAQVFHGTVRECWTTIQRLQSRGAGVFITVNETDLTGRSAANIINRRAVWADMDKAEEQHRTDWPIAPHLTVESSPGKFHYYWRTSAPDDVAHAAILDCICKVHGADPGAKGVNRVLRLAGTIHQKDQQRQHMVMLVDVLERPAYTWKEVCDAFPVVNDTSRPMATRVDTFQHIQTLLSGSEGMHEAAVHLSARQATHGFDQESNLAILRALIGFGKGAERWNAAGRDGELTRLVAGAYEKTFGFRDVTTGETLDPVNLFPSATSMPAFIPSDFPPLIATLAGDISYRMGCDPLIPAFTAIVACSALIPDRFKVQVKANDKTWHERCRIWAALVGDPSSKKSPAMAAILVHVYALQSRCALAHKIAHDAWKHQCEKAREAKQPAPEAPKSQRVVAGDTTTEALVNILETNTQGLLVVYDELTSFFGSHDAYRPAGTSKDKPFFLQSFNGGPYMVDRASKGERFVENLSLCLLGGIQPQPMQRIASKLDDDGLMQRFIFLPVASAKPGADVPANEQAAEDFARLVQELFDIRDVFFSSWPDTYVFSPTAQKVVDHARRRFHAMGNSPGTDKRLASALGKADGQLARLILTFHIVTDRTEGDLFTGQGMPAAEISESTAQMGVRLFFNLILPAMHKFYAEVIGLSPTHEHARWIAGLILAREMSEITERDIYRAYAELRDEGRRNIAPAMAQLELASWVTPQTEKRGAVTEWRVNPLVHQKFAELAIVERDRRERERAEICKNAGMSA